MLNPDTSASPVGESIGYKYHQGGRGESSKNGIAQVRLSSDHGLKRLQGE